MRILLTVHHELDPNSGAPGGTLQLADQYRRRGHQVEVLGFGELLAGWLPEQAKMVAFPWALAAHLARGGRRSRFDVIDASTGDAWLIGAPRRAFPARVQRSLLVTRSWGLEHTMDERRRADAAAGGEPLSWRYPRYHGGYRLKEVARSLRAADVALFMNRYDAALAVERLGVSPERVGLVSGGISDALIGLPAPQPFSGGAFSGGGRIAVIGTYLARKGVAHAATALNTWLPRHPDWALTFLGTGVEEARVLADYDPSLHSRISVVPRYANDDLGRLLDGHHIHLFPTLSEGWGMALVEAMACGLAPVVSDVPGPTELVHDGDDAIVVPPGEPGRITAALDRLAADRSLLDRLRGNAHRAAQSYGWSTVAGEQLALYEEHLARRPNAEVAR